MPAVLLTLMLASMMAFVLARFSFKLNLTLLGVFIAANLLPPQALLIPIYRAFRAIPVPEWLSDSETMLNSYLGLILINTAFQMGFCTFVLSNYMKALPHELYESAEVDGASVWRQYWQITMPLCRPALAALATLEVTWIYNEFFWATVLLQSGDKFPVTSALNNLKGQFFVDYNLLSAGSVLVALPPIIVFFLLQKQFVAGLTLAPPRADDVTLRAPGAIGPQRRCRRRQSTRPSGGLHRGAAAAATPVGRWSSSRCRRGPSGRPGRRRRRRSSR